MAGTTFLVDTKSICRQTLKFDKSYHLLPRVSTSFRKITMSCLRFIPEFAPMSLHILRRVSALSESQGKVDIVKRTTLCKFLSFIKILTYVI